MTLQGGPSTAAAEEVRAASVKPVKILLVDDQPENLLSAGAVLESLGEEVVKAQSGREALLHLLDNEFAVVLLDIMMPVMDGFETAALIRQRDRSRYTPIIFLTALGQNEDHVLRGYDLGAVDYISKPIVPQILRSKVSVFVELHRKSQLLAQQSKLLENRNAELQEAIARSLKAEEEITALNQHLERRIGELAEVNHELETFSYTVSHDLRAPLSRISGFSRALLDFHADQLEPKARVYLERIEHSATRMCELVEGLLNFSRLTRVNLTEQSVDMSAAAASIIADLRARDPDRQVEFVCAPDVQACGDSTLLRAVLFNLLENAWKYTRKHATARIEFGGFPSAEGPVYFVRDDGAGFDMADVGRLFRPFQRLHEGSDFQGSGIGLASVERIIHRHGGRIWADGAIERGATFYFVLPGEVKR